MKKNSECGGEDFQCRSMFYGTEIGVYSETKLWLLLVLVVVVIVVNYSRLITW